MRTLNGWLLVCAAVMLSACSTFGSMDRTKKEPKTSEETLIATNFVNTMVQLHELNPAYSMLQFTADSNRPHPFTQALQSAASKAGYGIQLVKGQRGTNHVSFDIQQIEGGLNGQVLVYVLSVGNIDLRREYASRLNGNTVPTDSMRVRGAHKTDTSLIKIDDSLFFPDQRRDEEAPLVAKNVPQLPADGAGALGVEAASTTALANTDGVILNSVVSPETNKQALASQPSLANAVTDSVTEERRKLQATPVVAMAHNDATFGFGKENIAQRGESNYENIFSQSQNVNEEVLTFPNDSYTLGLENKRRLDKILENYNEQTDVISIVGCSTGKTAIENGNAALAIGRANRVKEQLLYTGVANDQILEEGCWASEANSTPFPNRGVVVTIKRIKEG